MCFLLHLQLLQPLLFYLWQLCAAGHHSSLWLKMSHTSVGSAPLGQYDVVLTPQLILRDTMRGAVGLTTVLQPQHSQSQMPSQAYGNYVMGYPRGSFLFQSWAFHSFIMLYVGAFYGFDFCFQVPMWLPCSPMGAELLGFAVLHLWGEYPLQAYVPSHDGPCQEYTKLLFLPLLWVGGASCTSFSWLPAIPLYIGAYIPPSDTVNSESVMSVKSGDSGVVTGYWVDEFTHTWSVDCFVAWSLIYSGLTGKVSTLPTSSLNQVLRITAFWTKQLKTLSMVLILSSWTKQLKTLAWCWFYPHGLCQHTKTGSILWWDWWHAFFSVFSISMFG